MADDRNVCWYCGGQLVWNSDFDYSDVFGDGEGIVTYLHCANCGADVQYSLLNGECLPKEEDSK